MDKKTSTSSEVNSTRGDNSPKTADKLGKVEIPAVSLPKSGGAIKSIDEKLHVIAANGSSSFSIPLPSPTARGYGAALELTYNSGNGNGPFGLGWSLNVASIRRKTDKQLPMYADSTESDTYIFSGGEDLVPRLKFVGGAWVPDNGDSADGKFHIKRYRPRIEGAFAKIERWTNKSDGDIYWKVTSKDNTISIFGESPAFRISDPSSAGRTFEWLLQFAHDDKGNCVSYEYRKEDAVGLNKASLHNRNRANGITAFTNTYIKRVWSGNITPYYAGDNIPSAGEFLFELVLDYGEHEKLSPPFSISQPWDYRADAFSDYRSGFEIRTARLCNRVLMYHHFAELPGGVALVSSLDFTYDNNDQQGNFLFLREIKSKGYIKHPDNTYTQKELPPLTFSYQKHEWNKKITVADTNDLMHLPIGIYGPLYQWVDLYSEGISGVLTEQADNLYYNQNLGNGCFANARKIAPKPSLTMADDLLQIQELEADGVKYLSGYAGGNKGFYKIDDNEDWLPFRPFDRLPNIDFNDLNTKFLDLNGDGRAEVLITEDNVLTWYPCVGEKGFEQAKKVWKAIDDERGPHILFNDREQSIYLSDMSGDGLTDIVQIRNGSVCYWPNLGYGRFGAKVTMDHAPLFDYVDQFDPSRIRLADIDGSGTTDIVYLGRNEFKIWLNQNGNEFLKQPISIDPFPEITNVSQVAVLDFLGSGTSCIVWSSSNPKDQNNQLRYVDIMNSRKPHIMTGYKNNMGKEAMFEYTSSTVYYLRDKLEGQPWVTKLPFPVQCLSKVVSYDRVMKTRFASEYTYHHGYYDHTEREFRGFGRVDQTDAEDVTHFIKQSGGASNNTLQDNLHQFPVLTKTWFHTGAFLDGTKILDQFSHEYSSNPIYPENLLDKTELPSGLSGEEWRQALRACKSMVIRTEVYALDKTAYSEKPYSVQQQNCLVRLVQPMLENKHASFLVLNSESITYQYERDLGDPRIKHTFTLDVDEFANVNKSATVVYPRKPPAGGGQPHPIEQTTCYAIYTENEFTPFIDSNAGYRGPVQYQIKTFEVTGLPVAPGFYSLQQIRNSCATAAPINFDSPPNGALEKRLIEWSRVQLRGDDGVTILPFGIAQSKALVHRIFKAAFNQTSIAGSFNGKISAGALGTTLLDANKGGYLLMDGYYWVPSATTQYDALHFYLPVAFTDIAGNSTQVFYDNTYYLFIEKIIDSLNNENAVPGFNYRVLQPYILRDENDNLTAVRFDELGWATKAFFIGKRGVDQGDEFDFNVVESSGSDAPGSALEYHLFEWFNQSTNPSFDYGNYKPMPNYIRNVLRETHFHASEQHASAFSEIRSYHSGTGQEILKKTQAEPGEAIKINIDGTTEVVDTTPNLRWVGNGRTIFNNKGNPVKQYEPYFSVLPGFEDEADVVELGVTPVLHYDPLSRLVKTDMPNGTFSKVEFTPWQQRQFDLNDTVGQSEWYDRRILHPVPGVSAMEIDAAQKAFKHNLTPVVLHMDSLGRVFLTERDNATEKITQHSKLDIQGNDLVITDSLFRKAMIYVYDMIGRPIVQTSLDAGTRWLVLTADSLPLIKWDERDHRYEFEYDALRRAITSTVTIADDPPFVYNRIEYGESLPSTNAKANNLLGNPYKSYDQSGVQTTEVRDFKGNVISSSRQLITEYKNMVDWTTPQSVALESEIFNSWTEYDALNRPVKLITPHDASTISSIVYPVYNEANLLDKVEVDIRGSGNKTICVSKITYNAKAQRESILYGNGTKTTYTYDHETFRLMRLKTTRNPGPDILQDIQYSYDPAGNITQIGDDAHDPVFFENDMVTALNSYEYDAVYRLIKATGRKHAGQTSIQSKGGPFPANFRNHAFIGNSVISPNDVNAFRNYTESYVYDKAGNMKEQRHVATNSSWTRTFQYDNDNDLNNRLTRCSIGTDDYDYTYDAHGNMYGLETTAGQHWNFMDQLKDVDLGGGGKVFFVYDADGQRRRKVTERQNGTIEERIYLGGFEIYRERNAPGDIVLRRETLHITDGKKTVAMIETPVIQPAGSAQFEVIRYQYGDHLGSVAFELDDQANLISYEEYFPFGTTSYAATDGMVEVSARRYRYTGKERDEETGLYDHGMRYYAPWLCRWTTTDPVGIKDGLNIYSYVGNNPVIKHDPEGTDGQKPNWQTVETEDDSAIYAVEENTGTFLQKTDQYTHLYKPEGGDRAVIFADDPLSATKKNSEEIQQQQPQQQQQPAPEKEEDVQVEEVEVKEKSWKESKTVQLLAGIAMGGLQGWVPGGFIANLAPVPTKEVAIGRAVGEMAMGAAQLIVGGFGMGGGAAISVSGIGAVVGVPAAVVSTAVAVQGVTNIAAGSVALNQALNMPSSSEPSSNVPDKKVLDNDKADLAKFRDDLKLPASGAAKDKSTLAKLTVDDKSFFGINAHGQKSGMRVNAISKTHAEMDVFQQAAKSGVKGGKGRLVVDRELCKACGDFGAVKSLAKQLGLEELFVSTPTKNFFIKLN